ncbi:hypothetical protein K450DRAFT_243599 [Umbelopsis ramanniana AG]|uniref:Uncharacterized protein n=1 Tax=Umbelopsis ramanniana AG TaxID=1314678 RepID=A0AAD5HCB4_UMBRA|nr:uncharacterized protein K450DRAFT_243599 [Umbelopsis ramanniana AG]KAI8579045.1 hypothetical protein K450DRAFT_243599 [Umbelopsis ramanniana AG]
MNPSYWAGPCIGIIIYKYFLSYSLRSEKKKTKKTNLSPQQLYEKKKNYFFHHGQNLTFQPNIEYQTRKEDK